VYLENLGVELVPFLAKSMEYLCSGREPPSPRWATWLPGLRLKTSGELVEQLHLLKAGLLAVLVLAVEAAVTALTALAGLQVE